MSLFRGDGPAQAADQTLSTGSCLALSGLDELANAESLMDMLGLSRLAGPLTRTGLTDHLGGHDRPRWLAQLDRVTRGGSPSSVIHQLQSHAGPARNAVTTFVPFIAQGRVRGTYIVVALLDAVDDSEAGSTVRPIPEGDVTPAKGAHAAGPVAGPHLLAPQLLSQTAALTIADVTEPDEPLVLVSPAFEALTGYTAAELLGRNCRLLQGPDTEPEAVAAIRDAITAGRVLNVTLTNYRRDGSAFRNQLSLAPIRDPFGVVTHYIGYQLEAAPEVVGYAGSTATPAPVPPARFPAPPAS